MTDTIYCLVDSNGDVYANDSAESYAEVAAAFGLEEQQCYEYRYDLGRRRLFEDRGSAPASVAARAYFATRLGTAARLMQFVADGHVPHSVLTEMLDAGLRRPYLDACTSIERKYTSDCRASGDPCLESGCSIDTDAGEVCLQPLLRAGEDYEKACAAAWIALFQKPANRIEAWRAN
jgi:hypothetical protein